MTTTPPRKLFPRGRIDCKSDWHEWLAQIYGYFLEAIDEEIGPDSRHQEGARAEIDETTEPDGITLDEFVVEECAPRALEDSLRSLRC